MGVTTYLSATLYEDVENGNVIEFLGDGSENGYRIGNFHGRVNAWNNSSEKHLTGV